MKKDTILVIIAVIITTSIIVGAIIISNSNKQKVEYYCKISEEELNNNYCVADNECLGGQVCQKLGEPSNWHCTSICGEEGCTDINTIREQIRTQQKCEEIGGSWDLRLA